MKPFLWKAPAIRHQVHKHCNAFKAIKKASDPKTQSTMEPLDAHGQGFILQLGEYCVLFCFGALMDPSWLMDLFWSGEAPGHQETLKTHYEMTAKGFLLTFELVMDTMNQ